MPKTTKREETRRAERIRRAHATELPKVEIKDDPRRRSPGYKAPTRGLARYPWATVLIILLLIGIGTWVAYATHIGPFAPKPKPVSTPVATTSPCTQSKILSQITDTSAAPTADQVKAIQHSYDKAPEMTIDTAKKYCAGINTNRGLIVVELNPAWAPQTVNNFVFLAQHQYYDGLTFHRVNSPDHKDYPPFMIQGGDPQGNGSGGPGYTINDELPPKSEYLAGTVAMAKTSAPNSAGSQFFINIEDNTNLPKDYTVFGKVVQGMDIVKQIQGPGDDPSTKGTKPDVMEHVKVVAGS